MSVQNIIRVLLPKEDHFYDRLEEQARLAHEGVELLKLLQSESIPAVRQKLHAVEKKGGAVRHDLEDALARTFVTPLDREDIHRLSSLLQSLLEKAHACVSALDMLCAERPSDDALELFKILTAASKVLAEAMPALRKHMFAEIRIAAREIKALERQGDEVFRTATKSLFSSADIDARALIRDREIIVIAEEAIDVCNRTADYLANLAVKHG